MRPISDEDAPTRATACPHKDVRYTPEHGAIACYECGRLFGHLYGDTFMAYNPDRVGHGLSDGEFNAKLREWYPA